MRLHHVNLVVPPGLAEPTAVFVKLVLGALGLVVTFYARRWFGDRGMLVANEIYKIGVDQAAGWLKARMEAGGVTMAAVVDSPQSSLVAEATDYLRRSYPETAAIEPSTVKMGADIVAALGKLLARR